ncbi:DUF4236 domain-containing protein [Amycolatopsis sp. NBC_01488]|uniref:DUF4236 domain-containing protein n=1 Tax=Amycolatopsis sp. NBC_01488 TaxID=2903563 RepID=UPI002E2927B9|nr:DUF4236 domain-containing protein [Amycolatopsis sp. NBC_01488]
MSIYLRTSIRLGPLRVGVSKSGIGVSAGIPGLRVGTGPRGSYVRVGVAGVSYRATSGGHRARRSAARGSLPVPASVLPELGDVVLSDVTGRRAEELLPATPTTLVTQLNAAARAHRMWPWVLIVSLFLVAATPWILLVALPLTLWVGWRDKVRRTVVAFYEVDGPAQAQFERLLGSFDEVCRAHSAWSTIARGDLQTTYQRKVNAGAGSLVRRESLRRGVGGSAHLKANIAVPSLQAATRSVYFLPDRILVRDRNTYADLPYGSVSVVPGSTRFIEDGTVPPDAVQVDTTWQYVNKRGGPDRRFKNNRRLPVMRYGEVDLSTSQGFSVHWSFSAESAAHALSAGFAEMTRHPGALAG